MDYFSAQIALMYRRDVRYWHLTDKPPAPEFVAYWTNNGQKAALGLDLSAAIDPERTSEALGASRNASPSELLAQNRSQNVGIVVRPRRDTRLWPDFVPTRPKRKVAEIGPLAR